MEKIYSQLAKFQQSVGTINKDSKGYGYNYASFDHIVETVTPFLKENGLGFTHTFEGIDIICTLFNLEGEKIKSRLTMPQESMKGMNLNQSMGSSITYARRYTLSAILGLVTDEDTDGVTNTPNTNKAPAQKQNTAPKTNDKPWFNLTTRDGKKISESYEIINKIVNDGASTPKEIATKLSETYKMSKDVYAKLQHFFDNEPVVQYGEDNINLEEIPFD